MKKTLMLLSLTALTLTGTQAANTIWDYDFGTGTGTFNTNNTASTTFLPTPSTNGGIARVRVSNNQGGSFNLVNPSTFGTGSALNIVAPTGGSVNKFSIYDWTPATSVFTTSFDIQLSGGASGTFYFFAGDGTSFSDSSVFTSAQVFTGIRWVYGASDGITTSIRSAGSWVTTGLPETPFAQNTNFSVSIIGNNSASSVQYDRNGTNTLASNTWDLWIGSTKIGSLAKGALGNTVSIDSFMFYGESSTGNAAQITVDNFTYANYAIPEPATAVLFGLGAAALILRRRMARK